MSLQRIVRTSLWCLLPLLLVLAGCERGSAPEPGTVEVEDVRLMDTEDEGPVLSGIIINMKDEPIPLALVRITVYDPENRPVGDTYVEVRDVDANGRKEFRSVVALDGNVQRAQVKGIRVR